MEAVNLFASIIAQRGKVLANEYFNCLAYERLLKAGLIEEVGVASSIVCADCDRIHDAKIVYEGSKYGYYCPELGFVSKSRSELIAVQPNLNAFVSQIANDLGCKRRKSSPLDNDTWRIGAIDSAAGDVVLYLHPTLQDARDIRDVELAIASEVKSPFGLILTSRGTLTAPPFVTAQLDDVLSFDMKAGKFSLVADFHAIAGVPEQRSGGRTNKYRQTLTDLMALRASQGRTLLGRNEEAKALQAEFAAKFPNEKCPSLPTVKLYVTKIRSGY